jgi:hypothetical protein
MNLAELTKRARRGRAQRRRRARDPRYVSVVGRLVREGLLRANYEAPQNQRPIRIPDALWAGEVEPRVLELLPSLIVKRPGLFESVAELPEDLAATVQALRRDRVPADFRGISGRDVHGWLTRVGRRGKVPARLKSFRFTPADQRLLEQLAKTLEVSETEVIRRGLRALL